MKNSQKSTAAYICIGIAIIILFSYLAVNRNSVKTDGDIHITPATTTGYMMNSEKDVLQKPSNTSGTNESGTVKAAINATKPPANASADLSSLKLSVTSAKLAFAQNESIPLTLTAYNASDFPVTLYFNSGCETSYSVGLFNSSEGQACTANIPQITIGPKQSHIWTITHDPARAVLAKGNQNITVRLNASSKNPMTGENLNYILPPAITTTVLIK